MSDFLLAVGCLIIGYMIGHNDGWVKAHQQLARECKQLGSFYVGHEVFKCTKIDNRG